MNPESQEPTQSSQYGSSAKGCAAEETYLFPERTRNFLIEFVADGFVANLPFNPLTLNDPYMGRTHR